MSNNEKNGKTTELFFDLTMSDDNDLLTLVKEEEEKGPLNSIESSATSETTTKNQQNATTNTLNTNISIDLTNAENLDLTQLDDLVKETEELIETISATVQESTKISSHINENVEKIDVDVITETLLTPKEDVDIVEENEAEDSVVESSENVEIDIEPFDGLEETAITFGNTAEPVETKVANDIAIEKDNNVVEEQTINVETETIPEPIVEKEEESFKSSEDVLEPYIPHFISEELFQNAETSSASIDGFVDYYNNSDNIVETKDSSEKEEDILESEEQVLNQTGSFLFNAKDLSSIQSTVENRDEPIVTEIKEETVAEVELPKEQKQVTVTQSIDGEQALQISSIVQSIIEESAEVEDRPIQVETVVEEKVELDINVLNQSKDEFDIDSLLKRLDEISGKEMLTSVAPKDKSEDVIEEVIQEEAEVEGNPAETVVELSTTDQATEKMKALVEQIIVTNEDKPEKSNDSEESILVEDIVESVEKVVITEEDTKLPELTKTGLEVNDVKINLTDLPELNFHKTEIEDVNTSTTINDINVTIPETVITATEEVKVEPVNEEPAIIVEQNVKSDNDTQFKDTDTVTTLVNIPVLEEIEEKVELESNLGAAIVEQTQSLEAEKNLNEIPEEIQSTQTRKAKKNTTNTILLVVIVALSLLLMVLIYLLLR